MDMLIFPFIIKKIIKATLCDRAKVLMDEGVKQQI